jgi:catechol 2,3-dioxygenase-like lactoylglutathione lyase family enzyme
MRSALLSLLLVVTLNPVWARAVKRPAITGIAFARFYTTNPTGAEKFYGGTLGFKRLESGGVSVYPVNSSQWIEIFTSPPPSPTGRMAAVAFTTRSAAGLERYLAAHGVNAELPLKDGQFGVRDPEGNLVIFVQSGSNSMVAKAAPSSDATSKRVIHVGFIVRDTAKEDAFWRELLGFRPYWHGGKTESRTDWSSMQVPEGTDWLEYMLNISPTPTLKESGVQDHFSLGTEHMADVVAALKKNQCEGPNCAKTQVGRDGKVQLNLYDPDLTRVEFMEFGAVQEPCCSPFTGKQPGPQEDR